MEIRIKDDNPHIMDKFIEIESIEDLDEELFSEHEPMLTEAFNEYLDNLEDAVILGFKYATSQALKGVDPMLYRGVYLEFWDSEFEDARNALERGDTYRIGSATLSVES